jgi:hypothetical protein
LYYNLSREAFMPPLSDPMTIRLPDEIVAWIDEKIEAGVYTNRSDAIRGILAATSETPPAPAGPRRKGGSCSPVASKDELPVPPPWFVLPLRSRSMSAADIRRLPPNHDVQLEVDPMVAPSTYVPFGILADEDDCDRYMVNEIKMGGGADLLGDRPTPLFLAREASWRLPFPSRLLIDPNLRGLPICKTPNNVNVILRTVTVKDKPTTVPVDYRMSQLAGSLQQRLMVWAAPETPNEEAGYEALVIANHLAGQSAKGAVRFVTLGELLGSAGIEVAGLYRALGDPFGSVRTEPLRIGLLAVAVEYREQLLACLKFDYAAVLEERLKSGPYGRL